MICALNSTYTKVHVHNSFGMHVRKQANIMVTRFLIKTSDNYPKINKEKAYRDFAGQL